MRLLGTFSFLALVALLTACADGPQRTYRPQPAPDFWRNRTVAVTARIDATAKVIEQHQCAKRYQAELGPALEAKLREAGYRVGPDADVTFAVRFLPALRSDDQLLLELRRGGAELAHFRIVEPQVCKVLDRLLTKLVDDSTGSRHAALNLAASAPSSAPTDTARDVAATSGRFVEACNAGDASAAANFFAEDAVSMGAAGEIARGKKQLEDACKKLCSTPTKRAAVPLETRTLTDDVAITRAALDERSASVLVWKKTEGRWLIVEAVTVSR